MAKLDFRLEDYAFVEWKGGTANWIPSTYQIYNERDWWREIMKMASNSIKPRSAKVV